MKSPGSNKAKNNQDAKNKKIMTMTDTKTIKSKKLAFPGSRISGSIFTRSDKDMLTGIEVDEVSGKSDDQNDEGESFSLKNCIELD